MQGETNMAELPQPSEEVLFTIKRENLDSGLRGYPVGYCTSSSVDPNKGLFYVGRKVPDLVNWEPEKVIFLLYYGREGTDQEIKAFKEDLKRRAPLNEKTIQHIRQLPKDGHPMKLFSASLLVLGMIEGKDDYHEDCLNVIAKIPLLGAEVINYHAGFKGKPFDPNLGYMENFANMLGGPSSGSPDLKEALTLFNILHYDHGGGNLSTFIGKGVASGLEDMYGSLSASMCALAGPRHGRANQDCLEFTENVLNEVGENATNSQIENLIRKRLADNELIFGFGHAVLRVEDPRATIFYELAKKKYADQPLVKIALKLKTEGTKVLSENPKISDPFPNVDAISGTILSASGFPYPEYFTILFGISRCVGIARQIVYERLEARDKKGTPIYRPKYLYKSRESN